MESPFFIHRVYFETSFEIPKEIKKEDLQNAVNKATSSQFEIFLSIIDEDTRTIQREKKKAGLELEVIKGDSIENIHNEIIQRCKEDHLSAFRLFFGVDDNDTHFFIIHAHHGIADGFMITSFMQSIYACLYEKDCFPLRFVDYSTITKPDNIQYPSSWNQDNLDQSIDHALLNYATPSICPQCEKVKQSSFANTSRIIDAVTSKRAFTLAKNYGTINHMNSCIHGMLLECYLRSVIMNENLMEGNLSINTITNLRRYLKSSDCSPNLFISSFPTVVSVERLLTHEENCATIQKCVSDNLDEGLPLALFMRPNQKGPHPEVEMEISNLGAHPKECFTRRLITQIIYDNQGISTISIVVWTDCESRIHLCGATDECYVSKDRLEKIMDGFVHQVHEFGVI